MLENDSVFTIERIFIGTKVTLFLRKFELLNRILKFWAKNIELFFIVRKNFKKSTHFSEI